MVLLEAQESWISAPDTAQDLARIPHRLSGSLTAMHGQSATPSGAILARLQPPAPVEEPKEMKMRMTRTLPLSLVALAGAAAVGCVAMGVRKDPYAPKIDPSKFQAKVDNPYFPLVPGTTMKFSEKSGNEVLDNEIEVTHDTKTILGVKCIVVHDVVLDKGQVKEETWDWYAQNNDGTVWYFGEDTKEFKPGGKVSTEGSWEGGVKGAQPGIIMPGRQNIGEPYRQEYLAGHAEDMGKVVATNESVTVPAGSYTGCLRTDEYSMLEAGTEKKWYCRGVGVVKEVSEVGEVAQLVAVERE